VDLCNVIVNENVNGSDMKKKNIPTSFCCI